MTTEILSTLPATEIEPIVGGVPESELEQRFHDCYRQKLAGKPIQEIADIYGVDRSTIWRWCQRVEAEAINQLANEPVFNIIVREIMRLDDLERQARAGAENTKSDRAKGSSGFCVRGVDINGSMRSLK